MGDVAELIRPTKPRQRARGERILVGSAFYVVQEELEAGSDRRVYRASREGADYVVKETSPETATKEVERAHKCMDLVVHPDAVARIVLMDLPRGRLVREWIDGTRGDDFIRQSEAYARELNPEALVCNLKLGQLQNLIAWTARDGWYIGKLDPEDMITTTGRYVEWTIIDCGGVTKLASREVALRRHHDKFKQRWGIELFPQLMTDFQLVDKMPSFMELRAIGEKENIDYRTLRRALHREKMKPVARDRALTALRRAKIIE